MIDEVLFEAEEKMDKAVTVAKEDFATIRTGRATPQLFSKILVDYYGAPTPINQLASFQTPEARMILISPFDKGSMHNIEKAIRDSDLGVNPVDDGHVIRVVLPILTEERRKEYIKMVRAKAEDARVQLRGHRRHAMEQIKKQEKDKEIGEDDARHAEKSLDALTRRYVEEVDGLLKAKETELLAV